MSVVITNTGARMDYAIALESLAKQGVSVPDGQLTQSYLRSESLLSQGLSHFEFPILVNTTNPGVVTYNTAKLLNQQDAFYVTHLAYWIELRTQPGDNPDLYRFLPFTYPSEALNSTGAVSSKRGYKLWSGTMNISMNGNVVLPAWDIKRHLYVPRTQKSAVNGPFPNSTFYIDHDQFDGATDAFYPVEPNLVFLGNKGIKIAIDFPESIGTAIGGATYELIMVLQWRGLLAQNVSKTA